MVKGNQSRQRQRTLSEDRVSLLPDCLLVEIISRLPETKEAIRTGTLSKRWQHLWPQIHNLIIRRHSKYNVPQFYSSIERIISQRGQSNLNKFRLHASYTHETESQVKNCIRNAITHNVKVVDLDLYSCDYHDNGFVLPEFFSVSSSFIHLTLSWSGCIFKKAYVVSWENLMTLRIEHAVIDQDSIKNILSGSPLLETLELYYCCGFERLDITNKSVKNLVFSGYDDGLDRYYFEINAPYILSLTINNYFLLEKLLLLNVSSVIKAELNYYTTVGMYDERNEEILKGLLLSLGHVKEVKIGKRCLEVLARLKAKGFIYPSNLKVLGEIDSS